MLKEISVIFLRAQRSFSWRKWLAKAFWQRKPLAIAIATAWRTQVGTRLCNGAASEFKQPERRLGGCEECHPWAGLYQCRKRKELGAQDQHSKNQSFFCYFHANVVRSLSRASYSQTNIYSFGEATQGVFP